MRGVKKCFGVLLVLATIFGLSLHVSSDVSAKKHEYKALPYYEDVIEGGGYMLGGLSFDWSSDYGPSGDELRGPAYLVASYNPNSDKCALFFTNDVTNSSNMFTASDFAAASYFTTPFYNFNYCRFKGNHREWTFGAGGVKGFDRENSITPALLSADSKNLIPTFVEYDHYYLNDTYTSTQSGQQYSHTLKASDLTVNGRIFNKFRRFVMPLDYNYDNIGQLTNGRDVEIRGVFDFSGEGNTTTFSQNFLNNGSFKLKIIGSDVSDRTLQFTNEYTCTMNWRTVQALNFAQLEYSCPFTSIHDYGPYVKMAIVIESSDYIWDTTANWGWSGLYLITDNDETPGDPANYAVKGSNTDHAPGSAAADAGSDDPSTENWFDSLINLFSFGFMNPFAPIFNLFNDQNSCANIPTIASMIHSQETQVCPWFDSNTRNIVTPVLGMASIMLVFGFAVRWLGSSSGNLFEDSASEEVSNQGGRWGHFKKGGN